MDQLLMNMRLGLGIIESLDVACSLQQLKQADEQHFRPMTPLRRALSHLLLRGLLQYQGNFCRHTSRAHHEIVMTTSHGG